MAIRNICLEGDEVLRKISKPVTNFDQKLWTLLDDMAETMHKADGVGLAAPQVGILRRAVVVDIGEGLIELINPVIVSAKGSQTDTKVKVKAQNRHGEEFTITGTDLLARAFCHEIDHLEGKIFKDIATEMVKVKG